MTSAPPPPLSFTDFVIFFSTAEVLLVGGTTTLNLCVRLVWPQCSVLKGFSSDFGVPQRAVGWQLALPVYITYNGVSAMAIIVDKVSPSLNYSSTQWP
jgi:hypothetical protein